MTMTLRFPTIACASGLVAACLSLSGCTSSPTYGTDKTAGEQLVDDLGNVASLGTANRQKRDKIEYDPRPGLVLPSQDQRTALAEPQKSLADRDNPNWVESPEETRQRLRDEAEENKDNAGYRSPLAQTNANGRKLSSAQQLEAYRAARAEQKGSYEGRRFLTDPPVKYREASNAEALADLGEPEMKKEKRRKKMAEDATKKSSWWQPFQ